MSELTDIERPNDTTCGRAEKVALVRGLIDRAVRRDSEMTLNEYQNSLHTYKDRHHECHALGLVGELGEVVDELKLEAVRDELKKDARWLSIDRNVIRDVLIAAGRVADMVKKATAHGVPLDREKLKKELGDVLWYITAVASDNQLTLEDVAQANIAKLRARYPNGFEKGGGVRESDPYAGIGSALGGDMPDIRGPEGSAMSESQVEALRRDNCCRIPPVGWRCTRTPGHEGPCAAVPTAASVIVPVTSTLDCGCKIYANGSMLFCGGCAYRIARVASEINESIFGQVDL